MRVKRSYIVLSFRTTLEAMEWLAWRMLPEDWQSWQAELDQTQFDKVTPVEQ